MTYKQQRTIEMKKYTNNLIQVLRSAEDRRWRIEDDGIERTILILRFPSSTRPRRADKARLRFPSSTRPRRADKARRSSGACDDRACLDIDTAYARARCAPSWGDHSRYRG